MNNPHSMDLRELAHAPFMTCLSSDLMAMTLPARIESQPPHTWKRPLLRFLWEWRRRHRHPFNVGIHLIGIPLAFAGVYFLLAWPWEEWYWGVGALVIGYVLQLIGHVVEGNDLGEWAAVKRLLGLPYVSIAPQWQTQQ
jgi:hypothetical protein